MCLGTVGVVTGIRDEDGVPMADIAAGPAEAGPAEAGGIVSACLLTCPAAAVGQTVLIHSGYVLQILDEEDNPS